MRAKKKKVLLVVTKSNFGGAQRYVYDIATNLSPVQFSVTVAFGGDGSLGRILAERGIRTISLPHLERDVRFVKDWRAFKALVGLFRTERPDVVHLNSSKAGGLGALAARISGVPHIVFTSHGLAYDEDRNIVERALIFCATWLTFLLAHVIICVSKDTYERARTLPFVGDKVRLVPSATAPFSLLPRDEARIRILKACHDSRNDVVWIGAIAEFVRNKGLPYAVDAFARLTDRGRANLFLLGDGDERSTIEEDVRAKGISRAVCIPGYIPEARELLHAFDILLMPSVKEGLPYALLEAGLARLPVIGSDIGGIRDIIEDGVTGLLVPARNPEALARAIERLIRDEGLRMRLGNALYEKISCYFSFPAMLAQTVRLYAKESTTSRR